MGKSDSILYRQAFVLFFPFYVFSDFIIVLSHFFILFFSSFFISFIKVTITILPEKIWQPSLLDGIFVVFKHTSFLIY